MALYIFCASLLPRGTFRNDNMQINKIISVCNTCNDNAVLIFPSIDPNANNKDKSKNKKREKAET